MITSRDFISEARKHLGVKYLHLGRDPSKGLDCIGLLARVATDLGLEVKDNLAYSKSPDPLVMGEGLKDHMIEIPKTNIVPGTVVWIKFLEHPQHVALVTDRDTIIHSYERVGGVVEHRFSRAWRRRVSKAFIMKGVLYE